MPSSHPLSKAQSVWLWRPTTALVNSVRFIGALFSITILLLVAYLAFSVYERHHVGYFSLSQTIEESNALAEKTKREIGNLNHQVGAMRASLEKDHAEVIRSVADVGSTLGTVIRADGQATRQAVQAIDVPQKNIAAELAAARQDIAEQRRFAAEEFATIKEKIPATAPVQPPTQVSSPPPLPIKGTEIPGSSVQVKLVSAMGVGGAPGEDPNRNVASYPQGGSSRVFSRGEIRSLDVFLAQNSKVRATLIFKGALNIGTKWTRTVDLNEGGRFEEKDMKGAEQVVFWSDDSFWLTWKKY